MAEIQGLSVNVELSADSGTTWKTLICEISNSLNQERETNSTRTKCDNGVAKVGLGALSWSIDFEAACDTAPTTSQVTYNDLNGYINAGTLIQARIQYDGTGTEFYHKGDVYVTSLTLDSSDGDIVKFSGTLSGTGALDITP